MEVTSIGLDLSLSGTGICVVDSNGVLLESNTIKTSAPEAKSLLSRAKRIDLIVNSIESVVSTYCPCKIAVEGHSHGSGMRRGSDGQQFQQRGGIDRHELFGAVVSMLYRDYLKYIHSLEEVPPKSLKKWFTSSGNADKTMMGDEAERRGYTTLKTLMPKKRVWVYRDNEVDALALALWAKENS